MNLEHLYHGDNRVVLQELIDQGVQVDAVVTDPPYGLKFMGKKWDYDVPSVEFWKLVYQILKPGGHVLSFGGCYDEDTEVLTKRGWILFPNITKEDIFASLNPITHLVEWLPLVEIVIQPNNQGMISYKK